MIAALWNASSPDIEFLARGLRELKWFSRTAGGNTKLALRRIPVVLDDLLCDLKISCSDFEEDWEAEDARRCRCIRVDQYWRSLRGGQRGRELEREKDR